MILSVQVSGIFGTIDANCFEESVPHERSKITTVCYKFILGTFDL